MELDGFVSLWRKSINSRVFKNEGLWKVWTWCLMKANHEEKWVPLKTGKGVIEVEVKPGQFIFGRHSASAEMSMNPNTTWKRMKKLQNLQNITIESNSQYSLITIVNWDTYQVEPKKSNSKSNNQVTAKCQPSNTNNNDNNENKYSQAKDVLRFLNEISGRAFKLSDSSLKPINARLQDGYTVDDCKLVCRFKWNDQKFDKQYYRPQTLFRTSKFEGYLYAARESMTKEPVKEEVVF